MKRYWLLLMMSFVLLSCANDRTDGAATEAKAQEVPALVHTVYFKLKADISETDRQKVVSELKRLEAVPAVQMVNVGLLTDTGDARANTEYEVMLEVHFAQREDLDVYQNDALHLEVRENLKPFLAGITVFDYAVL